MFFGSADHLIYVATCHLRGIQGERGMSRMMLLKAMKMVEVMGNSEQQIMREYDAFNKDWERDWSWPVSIMCGRNGEWKRDQTSFFST